MKILLENGSGTGVNIKNTQGERALDLALEGLVPQDKNLLGLYTEVPGNNYSTITSYVSFYLQKRCKNKKVTKKNMDEIINKIDNTLSKKNNTMSDIMSDMMNDMMSAMITLIADSKITNDDHK